MDMSKDEPVSHLSSKNKSPSIPSHWKQSILYQITISWVSHTPTWPDDLNPYMGEMTPEFLSCSNWFIMQIK